jgi:hypothetical protein
MMQGEETPFFPRPSPKPTATRAPAVIGKIDLPRLFNGVTVRSELETSPGGAASEERIDPLSYVLDLKLEARVPTPNRTIEELGKVSPELGKLLPGLAGMIQPANVSPYFAQLYETKVRELRENLIRLDALLSRDGTFTAVSGNKTASVAFPSRHGCGCGRFRWRPRARG